MTTALSSICLLAVAGIVVLTVIVVHFGWSVLVLYVALAVAILAVLKFGRRKEG